jgi:hypothetical protein
MAEISGNGEDIVGKEAAIWRSFAVIISNSVDLLLSSAFAEFCTVDF